MPSVIQELPQMELVNRMLELPMVQLALMQSLKTYTRVKDSHQLVYWALSTAESSLEMATRQAAPYAKKLETPISLVDRTLCRGLDTIEKKVPIVKEKPELILENAYMLALQTMRPAVATISYANDFVSSQATSIKNMSWNKMNQLLSTYYGTVAVTGLDNTAHLVEVLIDKYFPPIKEEKLAANPVSAEEDKLLHTLQTVGRLSNKATQRVFSHVVRQLRTLKADNLKSYLSGLVEFLQLARYVHIVGLKPPASISSKRRSKPANGEGTSAPHPSPSHPASAAAKF